MTISIAMATYNGALYIQEQLASFARQTRQPDELVVSDDGSTDETLSIIQRFAASAPFPVRLFRNESALGYAKNFEAAMERCTGDLLFLSDQDDVWLPEKLERVEREFSTDPETFVIINDAAVVEEDLRDTGLTKLGQTLSLGLPEDRFLTGCCSALRASLLPMILPVPAHCFVHDTWLHAVATRLGLRCVLPESLQYYRRHDNNTSHWLASRTQPVGRFDMARAHAEANPQPWCARRLDQLNELQALFEKIAASGWESRVVSERLPEAAHALETEMAAVQSRMNLLRRRRLARVGPAIMMLARGQYAQFSGSWSFFRDLLRV